MFIEFSNILKMWLVNSVEFSSVWCSRRAFFIEFSPSRKSWHAISIEFSAVCLQNMRHYHGKVHEVMKNLEKCVGYVRPRKVLRKSARNWVSQVEAVKGIYANTHIYMAVRQKSDLVRNLVPGPPPRALTGTRPGTR